ncbi:MFS transporter, partial [Klebsiella pneumoniae]
LPISIFLLGYVFGPIIWGPLSEHFGRRNLSILACAIYAVFTMGCALAPSWPALLVFRFFAGLSAGSPNAVVAGILADIYGEPRTRGRAFAIFMATTCWGPLFSPIISGFTSVTIGWRWCFWIGLVYAGATFTLLLFLPETFSPVLLAQRAAKIRKSNASSSAVAPRDLEETTVSQFISVVVSRPLQMFIREPIVTATCAYLS